MAQRKHQVGFPDDLWNDLGVEANRKDSSNARLVRQGADFRVSYAKAARRTGTADPKKVLNANPHLLDELFRWCDGD